MPSIAFAKGHGLGNDYIVLSRGDLPLDLSEASIVRICDRNWGVGSDGILLLVPSTRADFGLRIFNPDGSEAEKSGNGLRIFAKYLLGSRPRQARRLHDRDAGRHGGVPLPRARRPRARSSPSRWAGRPSARPRSR